MERTKLWITKYDESWYYFCNRWPASLVHFFKWITHLGGSRVTVGIQAAFLFFAPLSWREVAVAATLSLVISHLIMAAIKKMVRRIRPYLALPEAKVHGYRFKDHSFPSGHATAIFSLVSTYIYFFPFLAPALLPVAFLVAFSRVVLGVHYPSDVAAGAILGMLAAVMVSSLF
ncbi:phosphatase PAP2 family protein [Bacillus sp. REN3]|uniref:phosphatase PAP2 family protein n=1 Tax=Bacillus sp. REN3 TaxID=2802440 RepID=UPI001AEDCC77|nr:phosphatase PAP2 family protein [Bacillus sp. REN3]